MAITQTLFPVSNQWFQFRQFTVWQAHSAMKVSTDACLFAAWVGRQVGQTGAPKKILDIGAGSGLLSLMLAQCFENAGIDALELNESAAREATKNFEASPFANRLKLWEADARHWKGKGDYDLLISNPPFHQNQLLSPTHTGKNQAHHHLTLTLPELLDTITNNLNPNGRIALLIPAYRNEWLRNLVALHKLFVVNTCTIHSKPGQPARLMMYLMGWVPREEIIDSITIYQENGEYTKLFQDLMRPYYLQLK
jgi:tRNA1Val (adenine37-N6)-methyltransferase